MKSLPRATPESQGVPSSALLAMAERLEKQEAHSLMVVRHGNVVAEGWWAPFERGRVHQLFSLSKSFCSTAVGLLVEERRLSLDDRVLGFFADLAPASPSENLRQMRVRDLLSMSCGHASEAWNGPAFDPRDFRRGFLAHEVPHPPGKQFLYNSLATYMCSAIVQKVTGQSLTQYLEPRLYRPLGIERHPWEADSNGIDLGGWGLSVTTEDIAKFGQLYLQNGVWEGKQLLPSTWVGQASARQIENGDRGPNDWAQGYGFQFWRCQPDCFRGDGAFGQLCVVVPQHDLVVAMTASVDDIQAQLLCIWEELLPKLSAKPLRRSSAERRLKEKLASLRLPVLEPEKNVSPNPALAGRYAMQGDGPSEIGIVVSPANVHVEGPGLEVVAGLGSWLPGRMGADDVSACAAWRPGGMLEVKVRWLEKTMGQAWRLRLDGAQLTVERDLRGVLGAPPLGPLTGTKR